MKPLLLLWTLYECLVSALACQESDIRITNENVTTKGEAYIIAGGLQMCVDNEWATVCQNGWDDNDATVACRQLGLNYTGGG